MVSMANYQFNEVSFQQHPSQDYFESPESFLFLCAMITVILVIRRGRMKGKNSAAMIVFHVQKEKSPRR
ncbi:hypothetical protein E2320_003525, partial [Naja naja]